MSIPGLYQVTPFVSEDERGLFVKDYSEKLFQKHGISHSLKEVFYTYSRKGVIRGMHFQRVKQQPKLVRCVSGAVFDVVCDLRRDSPTFRQWLSFELTGENTRTLLIPAGCAHGYLVLEDAVVAYKCAEDFYPEYNDGIIWNDPDLGIDWPVDKVPEIILSERDQSLQTFREFLLNC